MRMTRLTLISVCLAVGLATASQPGMAFDLVDLMTKKSSSKSKKASTNLNTSSSGSAGSGETGEQSGFPEPPPENDHPSGKEFPNGRPWAATEHEFEELEYRVEVVDYKVDQVKGDTETIIEKVDDLQSDINNLETEVADIKQTVGTISSDVVDIKDSVDVIGGDVADIKNTVDAIAGDVAGIEGDVAMLKNILSVEVSVGPTTDTGISLYVQVEQNGAGVTGLGADAFSYDNSFPGVGASYCGAACFAEGSGGVYMIDLMVDPVPGSYAGALAVATAIGNGGVNQDVANGTALVAFDVEPLAAP